MPRLGRDINLEILRVEGYRKVRFSLFFPQAAELTTGTVLQQALERDKVRNAQV